MPHSVGPTAPGCESGAAGSCRMWPHSFQRQRIRRRRIGARISQAQQSSTSVDHSRATESPFAAARRDVHPWNVRYCPQDAGVRPVRTASPCVAPAAGLVSHIRQRRNSSGTDDSGLADGTRSPGGLLHRPQREITGERVGITCMARARPEVFPGPPQEGLPQHSTHVPWAWGEGNRLSTLYSPVPRISLHLPRQSTTRHLSQPRAGKDVGGMGPHPKPRKHSEGHSHCSGPGIVPEALQWGGVYRRERHQCKNGAVHCTGEPQRCSLLARESAAMRRAHSLSEELLAQGRPVTAPVEQARRIAHGST